MSCDFQTAPQGTYSSPYFVDEEMGALEVSWPKATLLFLSEVQMKLDCLALPTDELLEDRKALKPQGP